METLYFQKTRELKRNLPLLKEKLSVSLTLKNKTLSISGTPIQEYEALQVLKAMQFGFSAEKALLIKTNDFTFKVLHIRDFTRRKNLKDVKSRIIGKNGKTKRTLENLSDSYIIVEEGSLGLITPLENLEATETAIENLIRGTKQTNTYRYLEKRNSIKKKEELGIKK